MDFCRFKAGFDGWILESINAGLLLLREENLLRALWNLPILCFIKLEKAGLVDVVESAEMSVLAVDIFFFFCRGEEKEKRKL